MNFQKYIQNQNLAQLDLSSKRIYSVKSTSMEEDEYPRCVVCNTILKESEDQGLCKEHEYDKTDVEVAPGIFQSKEDYEANMAFDEERDNKL